MITRAKKNSTNATWKPFATSTPLKIVPKNGSLPKGKVTKAKDAKILLQKNVHKTVSNGQSKKASEQKRVSAKNSKKNGLFVYFEVSSSSEDENDNSGLTNNGPKININSESNARIKSELKDTLESKKSESTQSSVKELNKIVVANGINVKSTRKRNYFVPDTLSRQTNGNPITENDKPSVITKSSPQKLGSKRNSLRRSNNSKSFVDDKEKENLMKVNSSNHINSSCESLNRSRWGKKEISFIDLASPNANDKLNKQHSNDSKSKKTVLKNVLKSQNSLEEVKNVNGKRKRSDPMINDDPENKIKRKRVKSVETIKPLIISSPNSKNIKSKLKGRRKHSFHQLFSDSKEQELINSLDLTVQLENEEESIDSFSKHNDFLSMQTDSKTHARMKIINSPIQLLKRSGRQRQQPKKFWLPKNLSKEINDVNEKSKNKVPLKEKIIQQNILHKPRKEDEPMKKDLNMSSSDKSSGIKSSDENGDVCSTSQIPANMEGQNEKENNFAIKTADKCQKEVISVCTESITKNVDEKSSKQNEAKSATAKKLTKESSSKTKEDAKSNEKIENPVQVEGKEEKSMKVSDEVNSDPPATVSSDFFKQLNQVSTFEYHQDGVQTAECWSLKSFKCGILKIGSQCKISNKTCFLNSYFGGIVVKGSLKMKIGSKDLEIKEGDMAFVPPLTEWWAIGTHENESLFYYWCGRFKT